MPHRSQRTARKNRARAGARTRARKKCFVVGLAMRTAVRCCPCPRACPCPCPVFDPLSSGRTSSDPGWIRTTDLLRVREAPWAAGPQDHRRVLRPGFEPGTPRSKRGMMSVSPPKQFDQPSLFRLDRACVRFGTPGEILRTRNRARLSSPAYSESRRACFGFAKPGESLKTRNRARLSSGGGGIRTLMPARAHGLANRPGQNHIRLPSVVGTRPSGQERVSFPCGTVRVVGGNGADTNPSRPDHCSESAPAAADHTNSHLSGPAGNRTRTAGMPYPRHPLRPRAQSVEPRGVEPRGRVCKTQL